MMSVVIPIGRLAPSYHGNFFYVLIARISPLHRAQYSCRSRLHRQVHVVANLRLSLDRFYNVWCEITVDARS